MKTHQMIQVLAGTYQLLNISSNSPTFTDSYDIGLLTYTAAGYMSTNMTSTDPHLRPPSVTLPPPPINKTQFDHEWAVTAKCSVSYAGPFDFNSMSKHPGTEPRFDGEVCHGPLTVASCPGMVGSPQVRQYALYYTRKDGALLKLWGAFNGLETVIRWGKLDK